jgi:hypothetical protein
VAQLFRRGGQWGIWLTTQRELFTSRWIRAIYDALATSLGAYLADQPPNR